MMYDSIRKKERNQGGTHKQNSSQCGSHELFTQALKMQYRKEETCDCRDTKVIDIIYT